MYLYLFLYRLLKNRFVNSVEKRPPNPWINLFQEKGPVLCWHVNLMFQLKGKATEGAVAKRISI